MVCIAGSMALEGAACSTLKEGLPGLIALEGAAGLMSMESIEGSIALEREAGSTLMVCVASMLALEGHLSWDVTIISGNLEGPSGTLFGPDWTVECSSCVPCPVRPQVFHDFDGIVVIQDRGR